VNTLDPILRAEELDVRIGGSIVLRGLSFDVREGGVTALLGRNGVGKTTTLRAILGLVKRSGRIEHRGAPIDSLPTYEIVRRNIAYVPEDRDVFASLTVSENLRLAERSPSPRYDLVYDLFPELEERGQQLAGTLSGGQQQMLAIGRALLNELDLLLVDEPTKGLAPRLVADVTAAFERIAELATLLLVEQNLEVVAALAEDVVVLDQGEVVHAGGAKDFLADENAIKQHLVLGVA
jgi:branched-chain amino acid transport system ATP-binding protein